MSNNLVFSRPGRANKGLTIQTAMHEQMMGVFQYELAVAQETLRGAAMTSWLNGAFKRTNADFSMWIDQRATANPAELQHVYDFAGLDGKAGIGVPNYRLFKLKSTKPVDGKIMISYQFLASTRVAPINPRLRIPNPITGKVVTRSSIFRQKAKIMESGLPVVIRPKGNNWLAVPVWKSQFRGRQNRRGMVDNWGIAFSKGPLLVPNPGGPQSTGSFGRNFKTYFTSGIATKRLKYSGYMDRQQQVAKIAGEKIPPAIKNASFTGSLNIAAIQRYAKLEVEAAARILGEI